MHFVDVIIRQAHPGPHVPAYHRIEEKLHDAEAYRQQEGIPWSVLVDDREGTVHQVYGGLSDPTYLIDTEGRIAYYDMWTYAPALHEAIGVLLAHGGRGVVETGINRLPYLLPAMSAGWPAIQRGLPTSFVELETAAPGGASGTWLGSHLRPLLAPVTQRAKPLPPAAKAGMAAGALAAALGAGWLAWRARKE